MTSEILEKINQEIAKLKYGATPVELYDPISYIMALGGKRMRPLLTILSYKLFREDYEVIMAPTIGIEVFHNFTLMHDDIMDNAPMRRGKKTVHINWNQNIAILSGDVMLVKAYELIMNVPDEQLREMLEYFNKTAAEVCEGQQIDMNFENIDQVTVNEYLNMIRLKTAVLLGFSLWSGAHLASANQETKIALYAIGVNLGIGFQLTDDLLDVYADQEKFGKQAGGDIISNKKTFLLISALEDAKGEDLKQLKLWLEKKTFDNQEKVTAVKEVYSNLQIKEKTERKIRQYFEFAFKDIEALKIPSHKKELLTEYLNNLISRES